MSENKAQEKQIKVAINGFGRIGRAFFRLAQKESKIKIVAINDLADKENLLYLLKYDTTILGTQFPNLGTEFPKFLNEPDPHYLPWKDLGVDVVLEATGAFNTYKKANAHINAGAKRVILSAPIKEEFKDKEQPDGVETPDYSVKGKTILMGINERDLKTCQISANGSCTTNAVSPVLQILNETIGVEAAILNTIHSYTATQKIIDSPNKKDFRKGRAGAQNIIPTTTGAAIATTLAIENLAGQFDGMATRVPVIAGSLIDLTFIVKRKVTEEDINSILERALEDKRWEGIYGVTRDPIVSSDIIGDTRASVVDLTLTKVVGGNLAKILIWYDNEVGYANTLIRHILSAHQ